MIEVEKEGKWREKEKERGMGPSSRSIGTNQVLNGQTGRKKIIRAVDYSAKDKISRNSYPK